MPFKPAQLKKSHISLKEAFRLYMTENITKCEAWFWRVFKGACTWREII